MVQNRVGDDAHTRRVACAHHRLIFSARAELIVDYVRNGGVRGGPLCSLDGLLGGADLCEAVASGSNESGTLGSDTVPVPLEQLDDYI